MCVCVLLLVIFFFCFSLLEFAVCFYFFLKTTHAKLDILFCFFSFFLRFVSSFEQSNGNCMIFCLRVSFSFVCFYCLKSGKCIIISVCLFSKSRSVSCPPTCQICLLALSLSRSKLDTQKWIFFSLKFKYGQIVSSKTLNHRVRKQQQYFLFVVVVGSTSLVVLDVVALRFSANAACVYLCELVMSTCLWLDCVCVPLSRFF